MLFIWKLIDKNVEYFPRNLHKTSSYLAKAMKAFQAVNEMKGKTYVALKTYFSCASLDLK